jgi:hypothetical protein
MIVSCSPFFFVFIGPDERYGHENIWWSLACKCCGLPNFSKKRRMNKTFDDARWVLII